MEKVATSDIKRIMETADTVSFDVFDTAVIRRFSKPEDIFCAVEAKARALGKKLPNRWANLRQKVEQDLREKQNAASAGGEITFDAIYDELHARMNLPLKVTKELKALEFETELWAIQPNPEILAVYKEAQISGKRIYFTSDIYFPADTLDLILRQKGFTGPHEVLTSCSFGYYKKDGLFRELLRHSATPPQRTLHIGDSQSADIEPAQRLGISALWYSHGIPTESRLTHQKLHQIPEADQALAKTVISFTERAYHLKIKSMNAPPQFWHQLGFRYFGLLTCVWAEWIVEQSSKRMLEKIFLTMRDGEILSKIFLRLQLTKMPFEKLYVSRKFLQSIGAADNLKKPLADNLSHQRTLFKRYLEQIGLSHKISAALVDVSWAGTILRQMRALLSWEPGSRQTRLYGLFLGDENYVPDVCGYLYGENDDDVSEINKSIVKNFFEIFDQVFTSEEGSLESFTEVNGKVTPIVGQRNPYSQLRTKELHKGIVDFSDDYLLLKEFFVENVDFRPAIAILLDTLINNPSQEEAVSIGRIQYDPKGLLPDDEGSHFIRPGTRFLQTRPLKNFLNSFWKIGFLRSLSSLERKQLIVCWFLALPLRILWRKMHSADNGPLRQEALVLFPNGSLLISYASKSVKSLRRTKLFISQNAKRIPTQIRNQVRKILLARMAWRGFKKMLCQVKKSRPPEGIKINIVVKDAEAITNSFRAHCQQSTVSFEFWRLDRSGNLAHLAKPESTIPLAKLLENPAKQFFMLVNEGTSLSAQLPYVLEHKVQRWTSDLIYFDETRMENGRFRIIRKPEASPQFAWSKDYIGSTGLISGRAFEALQRQLESNSREFEYIFHRCKLRLLEKRESVERVCEVAAFVASTTSSSIYRQAVIDHLASRQIHVDIEPRENSHFWTPRLRLNKEPTVTIMIPFRDRADLLDASLSSIFSRTTYRNFEIFLLNNGSKEAETFDCCRKWLSKHSNIKCIDLNFKFNYSRINNIGGRLSKSDILILMNNDTEVISSNWLENLVSYAVLDDVGIVGCKLLFDDWTIEHAGIAFGLKGYLSHLHRGFPHDHLGYDDRLATVGNFSCMMAACVAIRRNLFHSIGGLDDVNLTVAYNDIDLCLRLIKSNYMNVYLPHVMLFHHESKTRGPLVSEQKRQREQAELDFTKAQHLDYFKNDPFYSPELPRDRDDFGHPPSLVSGHQP